MSKLSELALVPLKKNLVATYTAKTIQISYPKIAQKMKPDPILNTN